MQWYCMIFVFSVVMVRYGSTQGFGSSEQYRAFLEAKNGADDNHVMGINGFLSQLARNCEAGNIHPAHCNHAIQALKEFIQREQSRKFSNIEPLDVSRVINHYPSFTNDPTFSSDYPVKVHRNVEINGNGKEVKRTFHAQSETKSNHNFDRDGDMYTSNTNNDYQDASNSFSRGVYDNSGSQSNSKYPSQLNGNSYSSPKRTPKPSPSTKITPRPSSSTIRTLRPSSSTQRTLRPSLSPSRTLKPKPSTKTTLSPSPRHNKTIKPKDNESPNKYTHTNKTTLNNNRMHSTPDTLEHITRYNNTEVNYSNVGAKRKPANLLDDRNKTPASFSLTQDNSYATDKGLNSTTTPKKAIESFKPIMEPSRSIEVNMEPMNTKTEIANGYQTTEESIQDFFYSFIGVLIDIENNRASNHLDSRQKLQPHQPKIPEPDISVIVGVASGVVLFCALIVTGTLLCRRKDKKPTLSPLDDQKARFDAYADTTPVTEPVYEDISEIETMGNQNYIYDNAYEYRYFHNPEPDIYNHIIYKES